MVRNSPLSARRLLSHSFLHICYTAYGSPLYIVTYGQLTSSHFAWLVMESTLCAIIRLIHENLLFALPMQIFSHLQQMESRCPKFYMKLKNHCHANAFHACSHYKCMPFYSTSFGFQNSIFRNIYSIYIILYIFCLHNTQKPAVYFFPHYTCQKLIYILIVLLAFTRWQCFHF